MNVLDKEVKGFYQKKNVVKMKNENCRSQENVKDNKKPETYKLNFYMNNCRGLQSKVGTVRNILMDNEIDIAIISETQCSKDKNIKIPNYVNYFRNRIQREKGGVCIYVSEKLSNGCMKLETGLENNEYFVLRLENFSPNLIVMGYYGVIEQQYNKDQVLAMQADIFNSFRKYREEGCDIFWCGDYNNHIPNELGITGNPGKPSSGGLNLMKFVKEENLEILNGRDVAHTHLDRSDGVSRILDLAITNVGKKVSEFVVDKKLDFTPYRLVRKNGVTTKRFSDHVGVKWVFETKRNQEKTNKRVTWNYDKFMGNEKFEQATNNMAAQLEEAIMNSDDVEYLYEMMMEMIDEGKKVSYGKITRTKSQMKRLTDKQIWKQRTKDIEKAILGLGKKKVNDRIWEMRGVTSDKYSDKQFVGVKKPESGEMTSSREETHEVTLEYNYNLLRKDDDEKETEENKVVREAKEFAIKLALEQDGFEEDERLEYKDFLEVIEKIKKNNKNVYRDFMKTGDKFKYAIFLFYQKCYVLETMPECFYETELLRLYKGKGNRLDLNKNRYIHLKTWGPKVYEKLLMTKMEAKLFRNTPECQVGGQKMGSTNEHLAALITTMRRVEEKQQKGAVIYMDIKACFDRVRLTDILFEAVQSGVIGRPLKNIKQYTDNLIIHMQGDDDVTRTRVINNSTGQGTGFAPVGTSMVMSKTLEVKAEMLEGREKLILIGEIDGIKLYHEFFVDDLSKNNMTKEELHVNCKIITQMLNELRLDAHPDKSGILVYGEKRDEFKDEIAENQPEVQGFKMAFKSEETYLGMIFSELGASDSITKTIDARRIKCLVKAADIKRKLEDERMEGVGWLAGAVLIHSAVIMSTLTYGAAALIGLDDTQWASLESIQRQCLMHILGISNKTTHQSLLFVLGLMPVKDVVRKLQISFVNNLVHIKGSGQCLDTLRKEDELNDNKGLFSEVRAACKDFGLEDVTKVYIPPNQIKDIIDRVVLDRQWIKDLKSKKPPMSIRRDSRAPKFYFTLPKNKAKLMLCYEVGDLNLRKNRKTEAIKKYGNYNCLWPHCREDDELGHIKQCRGYSTKWDDAFGPYEFIDYLASIELERNKNFNRSLINFKSF